MSRHEIGKWEMSEKWTHTFRGILLCMFFYVLAYNFTLGDIEFIEYTSGSYVFWGLFGVNSLFGAWRLFNFMFHRIRALIYLIKFRKQRKDVNYNIKAKKVFVVVTVYKKEVVTITNMVNSLLSDILSYNRDAEIFISVSPGDRGDREIELINKLIRGFKVRNEIPIKININIYKQDGKGKRRAMSIALRSFLHRIFSSDALILMDGDTITPLGVLEKSLPFLFRYDVGATTVNNKAYVNSSKIGNIQYYHLRFARRYIMLSSVPTVLTGRWSAIKGGLVSEELIELIDHHVIHHKRLGNILALTGDDKSTWYYILKKGLKILFIPDVSIYTMEEEPNPRTFLERKFWFINIQKLNARYAGNMFRAAIAAMNLGHKRIGKAMYYTLFDQRYFFWTPLVSRISVFILVIDTTLKHSLEYGLKIYILYLLGFTTTSLIQSLIIFGFNGYWSPHYIYLNLLDRFFLAITKTRVYFNLNLQEWKNGIKTGEKRLSSSILHATFYIVLITLIALALGVIKLITIPHF